MKKLFILFFLMGILSCSEDEKPVTVDLSKPQGAFTAERTGNFVAQSGTNSAGTASIGKDSQNTQFLMFGSSFNTALATGTVTVYLSTTDTFVADPANGNPNLLLLGPVRAAGENFFRIPDGTNTAKFTHVILWCGSVGVPFGNANLR
jgi:hypothetical protein